MPRLPLLFALLCLVPGAAVAATVRADGAAENLACDGGEAVVEGSRNEVSFSGGCRLLSVRGDGNVIAIELAPGAALDIQGSANRIRYTLGAPPSVRVTGGSTALERVEQAAPPAPPITLTGDGQAVDIDCAGRDVALHGNHSQYRLRGGCRSVTAKGDGNRIRAELSAGARAVIEGNDTSFVYAVADGGDADVAVRGARSRAVREGVQAASVPASAALPPGAVQPTAAGDDEGVPLPPRAAPPSPGAPAVVATPAAPPSPTAAPPDEPPPIAAGTPRLPALLRALGASVIANGTRVAVAADEVFQPGSDAMRRGGDAKLRAIVQLAALIHPSATRLLVADPLDTGLATRRAQALGSWFGTKGIAVRQADVTAGAPVAAVDVLLAR